MKNRSTTLFFTALVWFVLGIVVVLMFRPLIALASPPSNLNRVEFENSTNDTAYASIFMSNGRVDGVEIRPNTAGAVSLHKSNTPDHDAPDHIRVIITDDTSVLLFDQGYDTTINGGIMRGYPYSVVIDEVAVGDQMERRVSIKLAESEASP
ncbi:MAG: hypothetical protein ACX94C_00530 [Phycisphaerales bacterium]